MTARLRRLRAQSQYLIRTWRLIWAAARAWTLAWALLLVLQGLLPAATVQLLRLTVDRLVDAVAGGASLEGARPVLVPAVLMALTMLVAELLQFVIDWIRMAQSELIQDHISARVHAKATAVDFAFYESSEYHDRLYRARTELAGRPLALLESTGSLLQNGVTLIAMGAILIPYGLWVPLALVFSTVPALFVVFRHNQRYHRWWERTTQDRRWTQYFDLMLTNSNSAAEMRLFRLGSHFQQAYQTIRRRLRAERLKLARNQNAARMGAGTVALAITGVAVLWMGRRVLQGAASLGELTLFYQAFSRGQNLMRALLGNLSQIYSSALFLGNLYEFLDLEPLVTDPSGPLPTPAVLQDGIDIRSVTFRYPGSDRDALRDFSLWVPAGQVVAIVGANGAGKSTLLKLLCRLYDPSGGAIEFDGIDIRSLSLGELRRMITVLFQWPVTYHATAGQNVAMGDIDVAASQDEIERAARAAGAHDAIRRLPRGYDTLLGKWFVDGAELSAGEWQRIALARAFLRRGQVMVLDEPTSFMDSWAEADWFERFRALADGRTAVVITHRFTIAKRADIIHVMDAGRIVESGSHDELLALGGLYAQSWIAQTQNGAVPAILEPDGGRL